MSYYQFGFENSIQLHSMGVNKRGELFYTVVFLPDELTAQLPLNKYPRLRVEGEMQGVPFEGALQPAKGKWYLLLSKRFLQKHELAVGDVLEVRFNIGDQDYVDVPVELSSAINADPEAMRIWESLTPGRKRGFASMVASAKQVATREKRATKMVEYILAGKDAGGR